MEGPDSDNLKCPPLLTAVLQTTKDWEGDANSKFLQFLHHAEKCLEDAKNISVSILGEYRLTSPNSFKSLRANSTIFDIYIHYTTLKKLYFPVCYKVSKIDGVATMNYYSFEIFLREFNILPRLLGREDLKLLWRRVSMERIAAGRPAIKSLNLDDFKEFLIRLAIAIYSKPGVRNLITSSSREQPTQIEKVEYFCKYLHLDEIDVVKTILSQPMLIEHDCEEMIIRTMIREELLQKRTTKIMALAASTHNHFEDHSFAAMSTLSAIAGNVKIVPPRPFSKQSKRYLNLKTDPSNSILPEELNRKLMNPQYNAVLNPNTLVGPGGIAGSTSPRGNGNGNGGSNADNESVASASYSAPDDLNYDFDDEINSHHNKFDMSSIRDGEQPTQRGRGKGLLDLALQHAAEYDLVFGYDPELKTLLSKYCCKPQDIVELVNTEGPFVDMGPITSGTQCKVIFTIRNSTNGEISFDIITRGLDRPHVCHDSRITAIAEPIPAGMSRVIQLHFTVAEGYRNVLAFVDVHIFKPRKEQLSSVVSCPIYYEVNPPSKVDVRSTLCALRTLPHLLRTYAGVKNNFLNFDKLRAIPGTTLNNHNNNSINSGTKKLFQRTKSKPSNNNNNNDFNKTSNNSTTAEGGFSRVNANIYTTSSSYSSSSNSWQRSSSAPFGGK